MKNKLKPIFSILLLITLLFNMVACSDNSSTAAEQPDVIENADKTPVSVAVLKGPTGIGAIQLLDATDLSNDYTFEISSAPDEVMAELINGGVDIAALPTNVAAAVYNKSEHEISIAAINTLGVLHILERGDTIQSISDLDRKSVV